MADDPCARACLSPWPTAQKRDCSLGEIIPVCFGPKKSFPYLTKGGRQPSACLIRVPCTISSLATFKALNSAQGQDMNYGSLQILTGSLHDHFVARRNYSNNTEILRQIYRTGQRDNSGTCDLDISKPKGNTHYSPFPSCSQHPQQHYHRKPPHKMLMLGLTELTPLLWGFPTDTVFPKQGKRPWQCSPQRRC